MSTTPHYRIITGYSKDKTAVNEDGTFTVPQEEQAGILYPEFLPSWDPKEKYEPLTKFEHIDRGNFADPNLPNLLPAGVSTTDVTPKLGTEVNGVQLSQLSDAGKDELALFVAQRGVVIFRDQDFASKGPEFAVEYGRHFGRLHIHPTSGAPKGNSELHIVHRRADLQEVKEFFNKKTTSVGWHSDVSYERQPPGTTFFSVLQGPASGGDTAFADTVEAYNRLSPAFQQRLEGLKVVHSAIEQANGSQERGGIVRRQPVTNIHPLVRIHPVTKQKSLYVNKGFSRRIVGFKEEESDFLLQFLYNHIATSTDIQLRARWKPNTVVVWDNRRVLHSALFDWDTAVARHAFRITPQAEKPVGDLDELNKNIDDTE